MPSQGVPPPPNFHQSPDQVLAAQRSSGCSKGFDGSPGTDHQRHNSLPFSASYAARYPRSSNSEPASPIKMRPSAMRGAPVMESHFFGSVACTSHTFSPLPASTAIRRPSSVPQMTLPFHTATPRFTMPQQSFTAYSPGTWGSYFQSRLPLFASKA